MYTIDDGNVFNEYSTDNETQVIICIGGEVIIEEIKDDQGNIIETITKQFNIEAGEYKIVVQP